MVTIFWILVCNSTKLQKQYVHISFNFTITFFRWQIHWSWPSLYSCRNETENHFQVRIFWYSWFIQSFLSLIDVHNDGIKIAVFYVDPIMLMFVLFLGRRGTQGKITGWILIGSIRLFSHFKQLLWSRSHANIPAACLKVMWTIQIKSSKMQWYTLRLI